MPRREPQYPARNRGGMLPTASSLTSGRLIGSSFRYPSTLESIGLSKFSDMLIHLQRIHAGELLPE